MDQTVDIRELNERIERESSFVDALVMGMNKVIVGQKHLIESLLIGLLADGHILLEGVPGLAKTLAIKTLSDLIKGNFSRIQFTPDLLPADVVGTMIYSQKKEEFSIRKGPIFANLVLADEINRAPAKVQSALLEAMQERQVTIGESSFVENPKPGKKPKRVNHLKMLVIDDLKADTISNAVKEHVNPQAELTTDDATPYSKLSEHVKSHHAQVIKKKDLPKILPWVHIAIGNVKRLLLDVHHQLTNEYLQYYLNEFCYKFNRRYFGDAIFDRLLVASVSYNSDFRPRIYNGSSYG